MCLASSVPVFLTHVWQIQCWLCFQLGVLSLILLLALMLKWDPSLLWGCAAKFYVNLMQARGI
ncbi:hypothetical protein I79_018107 [Cricetulus griseus]|uniref:Uncharacterized protein n=1 Tax=Cricetulus griseus TaxID=10029 RepID=G3I3T9_CRIGR|nr:hypothetical protein I79_018107 [Cricetulus griseus]